MLRDYGSPLHPNPSAADYLFIPLIGSVVAIGGYVLAKTGLVVLSSAKGDTLLSPYMISLVGIISGLLAKEVVETISTRGRKILLGATQPAPQDGGGTTVDAKPRLQQVATVVGRREPPEETRWHKSDTPRRACGLMNRATSKAVIRVV